MLTVELDDFDLFMLKHSLEFRKTCYLKSRGKPEIFDRNLEK